MGARSQRASGARRGRRAPVVLEQGRGTASPCESPGRGKHQERSGWTHALRSACRVANPSVQHLAGSKPPSGAWGSGTCVQIRLLRAHHCWAVRWTRASAVQALPWQCLWGDMLQHLHGCFAPPCAAALHRLCAAQGAQHRPHICLPAACACCEPWRAAAVPACVCTCMPTPRQPQLAQQLESACATSWKVLVLPAGSPCCALQAIGISSKFPMMCACVVSYGPLMETFQRACAGGAKPQSPLASHMLSLFSAGCQD